MTAVYLAAVVLANLMVAWFGPGVAVLNAFLFIGLDLTTRDRLHDRWRGEGLVWKMGALIAAGGLISYLLNRDAGLIALASTLAFTAAALTDALIYHLLRARPFLERANGSNVPAALIDSVVFAGIAFGAWWSWFGLGLFAAKVLGGLVWSLVLNRRRLATASA